jgi:glutamyl-tRNA reductase
MPLVCLGLSHHTAPVDVRERHAFPASRMAEALIALRDYEAVREAVMLSTCGRLEIYAELEEYEAGSEQIKTFLRNFRHGSVDVDMSSYMYTLLGAEAIEHLFRVATGLDSMLIGEPEILGQVKDAYVQAQRARSLGKTLHALFREALAAGKAARTQTRITGQSTSVATAAIELAKRQFGTLVGKTILIVGAGKMGSLAAKRLRSEGCSRLLIANRSQGKARRIVDDLKAGEAVEFPGLVDALGEADIVVTSTGATHFILGYENVGKAMAARSERPLFVVDIAVPRDVDPDVAKIPNVTLVDIDALKGVVEITLEQRREEIPLVEEIIAEHTKRYGDWYQSRVAVPVVASLVQKAEAIREGEIERLYARCPDLTERERMLITGASLTIISKLLHSVVTRLRQQATSNRVEALTLARTLEELFDLRIRAEELTGHSAPLNE